MNVANNYYLATQCFIKLLKTEEALKNIIKANKIIDKKVGTEQNPMLFGRYRFLLAKVHKLSGNNLKALSFVT